MHTVSVGRILKASLSDVWAVLDDFGGVSRYNPTVKMSGIIDGPETGRGATRECVFYDGGRIEEKITDYEFESGYTVDFVDVGNMPLKQNRVKITVEEHDESETMVTMTATFKPKFGPVGYLMAKAMMESRFRETFEEVLDGLESHVRTGQPIGEDGQMAETTSD
ncbi:SRPBCC family protein [Salinigranum halophilum]|uniref:SRPBCC family protein n=1 Tax=Salinigranum halophilum TaxID=2565931 RepID=UPI0010A8B79C|nr:SRPBCC family protein [Salinigranum halophilum]